MTCRPDLHISFEDIAQMNIKTILGYLDPRSDFIWGYFLFAIIILAVVVLLRKTVTWRARCQRCWDGHSLFVSGSRPTVYG